MRLLQLHSDFIEYEPIAKEIDNAEKIELKKKTRLEELVVIFVTIEKEDGINTIENAVYEIEKYLKLINCKKVLFYPYSHLSSELAEPNKAFQLIKKLQQNSSSITSEIFRAPFGWTKTFNVKVKGHPLAENYRNISNKHSIEYNKTESSALMSEEKQKSFWFILDLNSDSNQELIPLEKYKFKKNSNLKKFVDYETSKRRNVDQIPPHVQLMKKMAIADYEPASDNGNIRYYPKGRLMKSLIEQYITTEVSRYGGIEVETPIMYDSKHPSMESYFNRFPARQYNINSDNKKLFLRFAACFGQFLMAKDFHITYKQLPLKLYELTRYSFRREKSGELVGLRRLRAFSMPDCHAMCRDMNQAKEEFMKRLDLSINVLHSFNITFEDIEIAIRFTENYYNENKDFIKQIIKKINKPVLVEIWKERFFYYVLKWEFNFIDNLGKAAALSTDQIDVENSKRYNIEFIDEKGNKQNPIILHNSPSGAVERIIFAILEKAAKMKQNGKIPFIPLWLIHTQVRLIPINEKHKAYVEKICEILRDGHIRVDIDDREESISKKIRMAEMEWIPFIIVIGDKEMNSSKLIVRERELNKHNEYTLEELIIRIQKEVQNKPFRTINLPIYLSKRPQIIA
ncbi:MAG: threonine--tRNA ligase [Nitrososphaeraceae archaeon]